MTVFSKIKEFGKKQSFQPNVLSIFLNPYLVHRFLLFRFIKKNATTLNGKLLDFGCGRKPYENLFVNVSEYIGVDIEVSGHLHVESKIDVYYDGVTIPFKDCTFDSFFCGEVIEHLYEPELILKEINRVLKVGSIGLLTFPFAWQEHEIPYDYARYTSYGASYLISRHGFEILKLEKSGNFLLALWQLLSNYIFSLFLTNNRYINTIISMFLITPFNLVGIILALFPLGKSYYLSNLVIVKKIK